MSAKWQCDLGNGEFDHDWKYVFDWGGDPDVVGGTFDCSRWECKACGLEDFKRKPPQREPELDQDPP